MRESENGYYMGLDEIGKCKYNRNFGVLVSKEDTRHAVKKLEGVRSYENFIVNKAALRQVQSRQAQRHFVHHL